MVQEFNWHTLVTVRAAVAKSRGLAQGTLCEARPGPFGLGHLCPGLFGYNRCAIGETIKAVPEFTRLDDWIKIYELDTHTAITIVAVNDRFQGSMAERREHMLYWLDREIAELERSAQQEVFAA